MAHLSTYLAQNSTIKNPYRPIQLHTKKVKKNVRFQAKFEAWKTRFRVLQPHCKPRRRLESTLAPRPLSNMKRAGWRPCCLKLKDQVNCVKKYIQTDLINSKFNALEQQLQSSIELTLVFDRIDFFRSKRPSIETTFDRNDRIPSLLFTTSVQRTTFRLNN